MKRHAGMRMLLGVFAAGLLLAGCGGGSESGGSSPQSQGSAPPSQDGGAAPSATVSMLSWTPPTVYNDNVALDPARDLEYYEIYVRKDSNFSDNDLPLIQVASVAAGSLVKEFTLELIPSLPSGNLLYVSMRAVGVDQQKSAFMAPLLWDRS